MKEGLSIDHGARVVIAMVAALSLVSTSCGGGSDQPEAIEPTQSSRCVRVAPLVVDAISEGLDPGLTLTGAQAVSSAAYERVWFVSAEIQGPGFEAGDVATWAVNRINTYGSIFSAGALAGRASRRRGSRRKASALWPQCPGSRSPLSAVRFRRRGSRPPRRWRLGRP